MELNIHKGEWTEDSVLICNKEIMRNGFDTICEEDAKKLFKWALNCLPNKTFTELGKLFVADYLISKLEEK